MQKDSNLLRKLAEGRYNGRCNGESEVRYALTISEKKYFNGANFCLFTRGLCRLLRPRRTENS